MNGGCHDVLHTDWTADARGVAPGVRRRGDDGLLTAPMPSALDLLEIRDRAPGWARDLAVAHPTPAGCEDLHVRSYPVLAGRRFRTVRRLLEESQWWSPAQLRDFQVTQLRALVARAALTPRYDIERFGIHFVASPRHADLLLVTGPVARHMQAALKSTYDATPDPKLVVAMGDCGANGGEFGVSYASCGAVANVIPVDAVIRGCPPSPLQLLQGIFELLGRC